ncbi:MAG: hypothetical protein AB1631_15805 [Acidobacteriota bacterium]
MKKYKVLPSNQTNGFPEFTPTDIAQIGQFAQDGDAAIVDDHIAKPGGVPSVKGGDFALAGALNINFFMPLRVWRASDGKEFADQDPSVKTKTLATADPTNPRIDLVYAKLEEDIDGDQQQRHFILDPTDPNSAQSDANIFTSKQNKITITVITGTPAANPAVPDTPADGVAMYRVTVAAGATALQETNVEDVRHNFRTLEECSEDIDDLQRRVNTQEQNDHRHDADEIDVDAPASALGATVQDVLNVLAAQTDTDSVDPIFRPEILTPELAPSASGAGKLGSNGDLDGATPVVTIPVGRQVSFFGGAIRTLEPGAFPATVESVNIDARIVNTHVDAPTQSRDNVINLSLAILESIQSDGGGDFSLEGYQLATARARHFFGGRLMAARDSSKIEIMGASDSSWHTIDTQAGTVTQRAFTGTVPTFPIVAVFPFGDGTNMLVAELGGSVSQNPQGATLRWYKVNAVTGASTRYTTAPGTTGAPEDMGNSFIPAGVVGDLIAPNVIFLLVRAGGAFAGVQMWVFHVDTNSFEQITPTGQGPVFGNGTNDSLIGVDACLYQSGKALVFDGGHFGGQPQSFLFDYNTRSYTKLQISQPVTTANNPYGARVRNPSISNIGGRVIMVAANTQLYELMPGTTPQWRALSSILEASSGTRGLAGMAALISSGLPKGNGFLAGGMPGVQSAANTQIWEFAEGGIVEQACGITLGGSTKQASFVVESITLPWEVGKVLANPIGNLPQGSIKIEYSFDGGATYQEIPRNQPTTVLNSDVNPTPLVRVTLIGTGAVKPCIKSINEVFEEIGGPGLAETVLMFNVIAAGTRYLYIDRDGEVTIETTAQMSTPNKCLLMKIVPNGASAPTPTDYLNLRWSMRRFTGTKSGGVDPSFFYDWAFLPRYVNAKLKDASSFLKDLAVPTITFNAVITVTGLANGESYIIECAG